MDMWIDDGHDRIRRDRICRDYLKLVGDKSRGLPGRLKLLFEILIAAAAAGVIDYAGTVDGVLRSLLPERADQPRLVLCTFAVFVIVGASNAVNLTDGLDGPRSYR